MRPPRRGRACGWAASRVQLARVVRGAGLTCAMLVAAEASAEDLIATTTRPSPIRSWAGVAAFSLYDDVAGSYRLVVSRDGGPPEALAIAPQDSAFDVDVGPDQAGTPVVVYSRCAATTPRRACDLYRYSLATRRASKLVGASASDASEIAPTIWGGRVAWARVADGPAGRAPRIYTRKLRAPRSSPSQRLLDIPSRLCRAGDCRVNELELHGRWLAINIGYPGPVCDNGQIRLASLAGAAIRIADTTCGLNGQSFLGLSFDARHLYFARFCVAEPIGCGRGSYGAFRYTLSTAAYALARFGRRLTGFAYDGGGRAYEVLAPDGASGYCGNALEDAPPPECRIVRSDRFAFRAARAPH